MGPATSKTPKHDEAVLSPPPNLAPYLATTIIIPDGWTQGIRNPDQDRMEVGGGGGEEMKLVGKLYGLERGPCPFAPPTTLIPARKTKIIVVGAEPPWTRVNPLSPT